MALASGTKFGPYEIQSLLGVEEQVYRARDERLEREVAIKVLPVNLPSTSPGGWSVKPKRFPNSHILNIRSLHDIGHEDGVAFLVMEYLESEAFEHRLSGLSRGHCRRSRLCVMLPRLPCALAKAPRPGITHRDLNSLNVMLTKNGAKLMDFGLAKQQGPQPLAATLPEMTVEQPKLTGAGAGKYWRGIGSTGRK